MSTSQVQTNSIGSIYLFLQSSEVLTEAACRASVVTEDERFELQKSEKRAVDVTYCSPISLAVSIVLHKEFFFSQL